MQKPSVSRNRKRERRILLVLIALVMVTSLALISHGDRSWPEWTGLGAYTETINNNQGQSKVFHQSRKTLWDMLALLIVPAMLAGGAYWLDQSGKSRERQIQEHQAQETALQNYLDKITDLLLKAPGLSNQSQGAERVVARSRTLTALRTLDGVRRAVIIRFLYESDLITGDRPAIDLNEANLELAVLSRAPLRRINLRGVKLTRAALSNTDLTGADLSEAKLSKANLTSAVLHGAKLRKADLTRTKLSDAKFHTGPLTAKELEMLPPEHQKFYMVKGFADAVNKVAEAYERHGEQSHSLYHGLQKKEIAELEEQLAEATHRKEIWLQKGLDGLIDEIVRDAGSFEMEIDEQSVQIEREFEQDKRRDSDKYRELEQSEKDLERRLAEARITLETFIHADLREANLEGADLQGADLRWANLKDAKLINAKLRGANLTNAILTGADLKGADLTGALLGGTEVLDAQLANAKSKKGAWLNGKRLE